MNYALTEDEFNKLDSVRGQLGLVASLLTANGTTSSLFEASDLYDFLAQQQDTLTDLLKLLDTRYDETRKEDLTLTWLDWLTAIDQLSGDPKMPHGNLTNLMRRLARNGQMYPDMQRVSDAFIAAIVDQSEKLRAAPEAARQSKSELRPKKMYFPASEAIASGKMLLSKSTEIVGGVSAAAREFGIDISLGRKLVRAYRRFGDSTHLPLVEAAGNASKLFELLHIVDADVEQLIRGLAVNGVSLVEIRSMTVWEIRKWLGLKVSRATTGEEAEALQKLRDGQPREVAPRKRDKLAEKSLAAV